MKSAIGRSLLKIASVLICFVLAGCYYSNPQEVDRWQDEVQDISQIDSVSFRFLHHYWRGYNFKVKDSLTLFRGEFPPAVNYTSVSSETDNLRKLSGEQVLPDSFVVSKNIVLAVAAIQNVPLDAADSVWVCVVSESAKVGWAHESDLLQHAEPNDPISGFISDFSSRKMLIFFPVIGFSFVLLFGYLVFSYRKYEPERYQVRKRRLLEHFNLPFVTLLNVTIAIAAGIYGMIQHFVPSTWIEYYFHPTLNPFAAELPLLLSVFIGFVWLIIILFLAVLDEVRHSLPRLHALSFLFLLFGWNIVVYLCITLTVRFYVGYLLLAVYVPVLLYRVVRLWRPVYVCGACGKTIRHLGKCEHCGALNVGVGDTARNTEAVGDNRADHRDVKA